MMRCPMASPPVDLGQVIVLATQIGGTEDRAAELAEPLRHHEQVIARVTQRRGAVLREVQRGKGPVDGGIADGDHVRQPSLR